MSELEQSIFTGTMWHVQGKNFRSFLIFAPKMQEHPKARWKDGKRRCRVRVRSLLFYWASRELGIGMTELGRKFKITTAANKPLDEAG